MFSDVVDETLDGWWDARGGVIAELRNIPVAHLGFRPTPQGLARRCPPTW